ncbi:MAG: TRAP transporter large permease subunit [Proteobacteria bacterium]|nr:TRAP transporter large permease subunit [Pseudomonadota bacterium]
MSIERAAAGDSGVFRNGLRRAFALAWRAENGLAAAALLAMALLPVLELVARSLFKSGIPGISGYLQSLTLWVGYLGAMIASRERRHLHLAGGRLPLPSRLQNLASPLVVMSSTMVAAGLFWGSLRFVWSETLSAETIGGWLPIWVVEAVLPVSFGVITLRFIAQAEGAKDRAFALLAVAAAALFGFLLTSAAPLLLWPAIAALAVAALFGAPIFVLLGGAGLLLFFADGVPVAAVPVATYRIMVSPLIPTIPLFTLAGYLLAEGGARDRLVRLFRALFGGMPGGLAIAATLVCAFFATFTGASGVVILALGGLLLPVLVKNGYPEGFAIGLLTATGSIGLLFPPSIAVILYSAMAQVPLPDLFKAALVPGALMVVAVCAFGVWKGVAVGVPRARFDPREAAAALWESKWVLLTPVIVLVGIFGGFGTLVEVAAITAAYVLFIEVFIHRDLHVLHDVPRITVKCATLIGGVFVILGVAFGLANYLVDAEIPAATARWVEAHVESRIVFLLLLNVLLIIVGCFMDIFSAIVVVLPLVLPMSQIYGIHPIHLGVIFLANLELGYLTPPVGLNLFFAAYRFEKSVLEVCRSTLPFFFLLLVIVLLITYVPALTIRN